MAPARRFSAAEPARAVAARGSAVSLYVLGPDLAARGIDAGRLIEGVSSVDYAGFVDLAASHDLTHAWL